MRLVTPSVIETAFWIILCGSLAVGIGMETDWGTRWRYALPNETADAAKLTTPTLTESYGLPVADEFLETAMRPLFIVTRRPTPPTPPPEPPKPTMKREQFTLTGITVLPGSKFAFLTEKAGNKNRVVQEGKEINGIVVKDIQSDRVVLGQYDETEVLMLRTAKGPAATIQQGAEKDAAGAGPAGSPPANPAVAPPPNPGEAGRAGMRPQPQNRTQLPAGQRPPTGPQ